MSSESASADWRHTRLRDGRVVSWRRFGSGPPVVMCHGTPWSSVLWEPIADALANNFTIYLWDMPGFGRSSMTKGQDVSLAAQARALVELVELWELERLHVVAHDVGGAVALRAHLLHGLRIDRLVLIDVVTLAPWGSPFFRLVRDNSTVFTQLPAALHEGLVRVYVAGASHRPLDEDVLVGLVRPWLGPRGQEAFYAQIAQAHSRDTDSIVALLPAVTAHTTIIWGREDRWIPVEQALRLGGSIPNSVVRVVDQAGHLIHYDAPEALLYEVGAGLGRALSSDGPIASWGCSAHLTPQPLGCVRACRVHL